MDYYSFLEFVTDTHRGQVDQAGKPYIGHLIRVAERTKKKVQELPEGVISDADREEALQVALGHDLIEDQNVTKEQLIALGKSERFYNRLLALSRIEPGPGQPKPEYQEKIRQIVEGGDLVVILVKLSDNEDNNDPVRMAELPEEKRRKLGARYDVAHATLQDGLETLIASRNHPSV